MALKKAVPNTLPYAHTEGNSPAHVKASLVGSSAMLIIEDGRLALGTWQGILGFFLRRTDIKDMIKGLNSG